VRQPVLDAIPFHSISISIIYIVHHLFSSCLKINESLGLVRCSTEHETTMSDTCVSHCLPTTFMVYRISSRKQAVSSYAFEGGNRTAASNGSNPILYLWQTTSELRTVLAKPVEVFNSIDSKSYILRGSNRLHGYGYSSGSSGVPVLAGKQESPFVIMKDVEIRPFYSQASL
jgi:hypothetical protein